jgi:5'-deoxynucleotidase YfbR-like HD superfamily hydrolase
MKFSTSLFIAISALCLSTAFAAPAGHGLQARSFTTDISANVQAMAATATKNLKQVQEGATNAFARKKPLTPLEKMKEDASNLVKKAQGEASKALNHPEVQKIKETFDKLGAHIGKEMETLKKKATTDFNNTVPKKLRLSK